MPYYKWTGITLTATMVHGYRFARSQEALEHYLFERDIALLTAQQYRWQISFLYPISATKKANFFNQLATLLHANVHLYKALQTLAVQGGPTRFSEVLETLALSVEQGMHFHDALALYPAIFDPVVISLCKIGQVSNLPVALTLLSSLLNEQEVYRKKLRSALSMPCITFVFFMIIMLIMFTVVVPHFANILNSLQTEIPMITKILFSISNHILSSTGYLGGALLLVFSALLWRFKHSQHGFMVYSFITFYAPYIKTFTFYRNYMLFFNTLGTMVQAGVPLVEALMLAANTTSNHLIQKQCQAITHQVQQGNALSTTLEEFPTIHHSIKAFVAVGEQSGNLGLLLLQAGAFCEQQLITHLSFFALIIQPLLLVILAGCVVVLMLALYLPILLLSHSIQ